ncbi:MAG: hypothetical protein HY665_01540 [Chloroflexi bacterium]|nr:hypothetical protein [Chloroflexota bacterium]
MPCKALMRLPLRLRSRISDAMLGCKLIVIFRHPTKAYEHQVMEYWRKGDLFSCQEISDFKTASGRRRARKRLMKNVVPLFRELKKSEGCGLFRSRFQEEWNRLAKMSGKIPDPIPDKVIREVDFAEIEQRRTEEVNNFSPADISDMFPVGQTVKPRLVGGLRRDIGDYESTIRTLHWETTFNWDIIREIKITKKSKVWKLLGIDPDEELEIGKWVDASFDFVLGRMDEDKLTRLARWVMGRVLVEKFMDQPYSRKKSVYLETAKPDGSTLEDEMADPEWDTPRDELEEKDILNGALAKLTPSEREAVIVFRVEKDTGVLRQQLGERKYEAMQRSFERGKKRLQKAN